VENQFFCVIVVALTFPYIIPAQLSSCGLVLNNERDTHESATAWS